MKILVPGNIPPTPRHWWVNQQLTCGFCGAVVMLEIGDQVEEVSERRINGITKIAIDCPVCKKRIAKEYTAEERRKATIP